MQLLTRDQSLAALRPYRGLEERVFAPTSSFGIRLGDNNDASYQFGKRGDTLPMSNDAWDYVYKIGGLKGVGLDKYPRQLVAPILDEALRRHEKELKAVVREGEIIAFTNAEAQVLDPIHVGTVTNGLLRRLGRSTVRGSLSSIAFAACKISP